MECSKKDTCLRFNGEAGQSDLKKRYDEKFNGADCKKFILKKPSALGKIRAQSNPKPTAYSREDGAGATFYSSDSKDNRLREILLLEVEKNFDKLFMTEMSFRGAEFYNVNRISSRVVDLLMPKIVSDMKQR